MNDFFSDFNQETDSPVSLTATKKPSKTKDEGHLTVDVYQTEDDIVVRSTIAGSKIEDIDIQVTKDMLTIKGTRKPEEVISDEGFFHRELYWGAFSRAIILPVDVDPEGAKASYKNGILAIRLPKLEKNRTKKLKISN
ncbi:MAG: Hsp20/alpha crystallin family protein [Candidatus Pacebacteria bacterium]|nr:Hsp20/alpha crystallin family protein [Candidatus Paceibacterota bacterium]